MKANIIKIGNSRGVRIPRTLLEESRLGPTVDLRLKNGKIIIGPAEKAIDEGVLLSHSALTKEWDTPEEDEAWASLQ